MKDVPALMWLPATLGTAVGERLQQLLAELATAWKLPAPGELRAELLPADVDPAQGPELEDSLDLQQWDSAALRLWLAEQSMGLSRLESAIVDRAMRQLLQGLGQGLKHCFGTAPPGDERPSQRSLPGHRGLRVRLRWGGQPMHLSLGLTQLQASGWLKLPARDRLAAVDLKAALAATPVPLQVTLGSLDLPLSDWLHLAPGDVLLLDKRLDAPLAVQVPGSDWTHHAQLGSNAARTHRALRWITR